jgi:hypothetical protein
MIHTRIVVSFVSQDGEHATDVLEIFIRIPATAHSFDVELECFIGEAFKIKNGHEDILLFEKYFYKSTD